MMKLDEAIKEGHYARKQLWSRDWLISWSHRSRFKLGRNLLEPYVGRKLLDYGCGDGTFLALIHDSFPRAIGADVDPKQVIDCGRRLTNVTGVKFLLTNQLLGAEHNQRYEVIVCFEVLEHCTNKYVDVVLDDLNRLATANGVVLISVPIEIGPSLIGKQLARRLAAWKGLGDYRHNETYTMTEFCKMVFASEETAIVRPVYQRKFLTGMSIASHGHKGFNWRALRRKVAARFIIEQTRFSPLAWLGGYLSSQAWFICKPR